MFTFTQGWNAALTSLLCISALLYVLFFLDCICLLQIPCHVSNGKTTLTSSTPVPIRMFTFHGASLQLPEMSSTKLSGSFASGVTFWITQDWWSLWTGLMEHYIIYTISQVRHSNYVGLQEIAGYLGRPYIWPHFTVDKHRPTIRLWLYTNIIYHTYDKPLILYV